MPIQKPAEITSLGNDSIPVMNEIISHICNKASTIKYTSKLPVITNVAEGEIVVYDNGSGTKRLYFVTGKKNLGYINLT